MKDARNRKARETQDDIQNFQKEMKELHRGDDSEIDEEQDEEILQTGSHPGRMTFSASASVPVVQGVEEEEMIGGFSSAMSAPSAAKEAILVKDVRDSPPQNTASGKESNPWLSGKVVTKLSKKKNESTVSKEGTAPSKAANKIAKHIAKGDEERREAFDDAQLDIDPEARLLLRGKKESNPKAPTKGSKVSFASDNEDSDDSIDDEPVAVRGKGPAALRQKDLVAEAFAGDDVTAEFEAEKNAQMEADAPQIVDTSLPGWGSWTGKGVRTSKKKMEEQKKRFSKVTPGLDPAKRKDANMTNVIISQKKDKKVARYTPKDVPYPYTSRAQYEMAMRNPLGPEWNTRTQHQKLSLPKVLTKPGKAIKPIGECVCVCVRDVKGGKGQGGLILTSSMQRNCSERLQSISRLE
jgi:U3 small nucleolar RNA-associated protein 14